MALGLLKRALLDDIISTSPTSATQAESITAEAEALLMRAGQHFRAILQQDAQDLKALVNWGKALCVRAGLAATKQVICSLMQVRRSLVQVDSKGCHRSCYELCQACAISSRATPEV